MRWIADGQRIAVIAAKARGGVVVAAEAKIVTLQAVAVNEATRHTPTPSPRGEARYSMVQGADSCSSHHNERPFGEVMSRVSPRHKTRVSDDSASMSQWVEAWQGESNGKVEAKKQTRNSRQEIVWRFPRC